MKWRKSKKQKKEILSRTAEVSVPVQIPVYAPNQGLQPREYQVSESLIKLESIFEGWCREFLSNANPDQFNGSYMDAVIQCVENEADSYIKVQRVDHINIIKTLLSEMHKGDKIKYTAKLAQLREELEDTKKRLKKVEKIYWRGTIYEKIMEEN